MLTWLTAKWLYTGELEGELALSEQMRSELSDNHEKQLKKLQSKLARAEKAAQDMGKKIEDTEHRAREAEAKLLQKNDVALMDSSVRIQNEALEESWISELSEQSTDEIPNKSMEHDIKSMHEQLGIFQENLADESGLAGNIFHDQETESATDANNEITHSHSTDVQKTREYTTQDGTKVSIYTNGTRKETFRDGDSVIHFTNGDYKQMLVDGQVVYFYSETKTTHTTHPDGLEVYEFPDGQLEKRFPDGTQEIIFIGG